MSERDFWVCSACGKHNFMMEEKVRDDLVAKWRKAAHERKTYRGVEANPNCQDPNCPNFVAGETSAEWDARAWLQKKYPWANRDAGVIAAVTAAYAAGRASKGESK